MKVLIAEDDMASGKFLMKLLSKYGHVDLATILLKQHQAKKSMILYALIS
ncbi:hypothetical protein [Eubacterium ruminantium]